MPSFGIHPAPPTPLPPAVGLEQHLENALAKAHFAARVDAGSDDGSLDLTVFSQAPFDRTVEAASSWLAEAGVDGTATCNEALDIVLTLRTAAAVDRLVTVLLEPRIRAHTAADNLAKALTAAGLDHRTVLLGLHAVEVDLADDDLAAPVQLASLLGATGIDDGLMLTRPRGMRRLAERLQWLLTGVTGTAVQAEATPGCAHVVDHLTLRLTIDQARSLTQRLSLTPVSTLAATGTTARRA